MRQVADDFVHVVIPSPSGRENVYLWHREELPANLMPFVRELGTQAAPVQAEPKRKPAGKKTEG